MGHSAKFLFNTISETARQYPDHRIVFCAPQEHDHPLNHMLDEPDSAQVRQLKQKISDIIQPQGCTLEWISGAVGTVTDWRSEYSDVYLDLFPQPEQVLQNQTHLYDATHWWSSYWFYQSFRMFAGGADIRNYPVNSGAHSQDHLFVCRNSRGHNHRASLVDHLHLHNLLESNLVSWLDTDNVNRSYEFRHWTPTLKTLAESSDTPDHMFSNSVPVFYNRCLLDVVTESCIWAPYFTEKTARPIMHEKPFIILGPPGINQLLHTEFGFELYTEIFGYGFDNLMDYVSRAQCIAEQLKQLQINSQLWQHLHQITRDKARRNLIRLCDIVINSENTPQIVTDIQNCSAQQPDSNIHWHADIPEAQKIALIIRGQLRE